MGLMPMNLPMAAPSRIMNIISNELMKMALGPLLNIFLKLNSRPNENIRKITPNSLHTWIPPSSTTLGM